jgi:hypothetical protein
VAFPAKVGKRRLPTTLCSVRPGAGELGVLLLDQDQQVHRDAAQDDRRDEQHVHDVEPADDQLAHEVAVEDGEVAQVPMTGIDSRIALMMRRPVPDSRSSGSEYR